MSHKLSLARPPGAGVTVALGSSGRYLFALGAVDFASGLNISITINGRMTILEQIYVDGATNTMSGSAPFRIPPEWDVATGIAIRLLWAPAALVAGNVRWEIDYAALAPGDTFAGVAAGSPIAVTGLHPLADLSYIETSAVLVPGDLAVGDILQLAISRIGADGADTLVANARLLAVVIDVPLV